MMKKVRNVIMISGIFFCWGILGSLELERLTLSEAVSYIAAVSALCIAVFLSEIIFKIAKTLIIRYARRRRNRAVKYVSPKPMSSVCEAR